MSSTDASPASAGGSAGPLTLGSVRDRSPGADASRYVAPPLPSVMVRHRRLVIVGLHFAIFPLAYAAAFLLRFDAGVPPGYQALFWRTLPLLVAIRLATFALFRLYNGWWRHVGMHDLIQLVKAVTLGSLLFVVALFLFADLQGLPRSVLLLEWGIALLGLGGIRFAVRYTRERWTGGSAEAGARTLIVGAGTTGAQLLRQLRLDGRSGIFAVGFVDDDPHKHGLHIHGVPVLGRVPDLPRLVKQHRVRRVVVAIPSATREEITRVLGRCMGAGIDVKIVPSLLELVEGQARLSQLRAVRTEDLLGRDAIQLDLKRVDADLRGRVVLITGGAGSIGAELARQVAAFRPARLVVLDRAESPLYFVDLQLRRAHPELALEAVIADVTDEERLAEVFAAHRPEYVFHAAAYKHVPMMEANVGEAVRNNVLGTARAAEAAARAGVRKFVLISSDKAVNPSSVMGATKRVAERLLLDAAEFRASRTDFRAVRFGNVLDSDGSVLPLFRRQIAAGGPVTVTHPEVTRYFMTIPEAVQLVLQAAALPEAEGRISMLEMGEPVRILTLAENLIRLSGLEPYTGMPIVFTGLRPGEKLHEELTTVLETAVPTVVEKIRVVHAEESEPAGVEYGYARLLAALRAGEPEALLDALRGLVPECLPPLCGAARPAERRVRVPRLYRA